MANIRKLETAAERERKEKLKKNVLSIVMLIILVFGATGLVFVGGGHSGGTQDPYGTGSVDYVPPGSQWAIDFQGTRLFFASTPDDTLGIPVEGTYNLQDYSGQPLYIDSDNLQVTEEIANTLGRLTSRIQAACHGECEEDLPEIECDQNLIVWSASQEPRVYQEDSCVFIEGDIRAVDAFLYKIFGIN